MHKLADTIKAMFTPGTPLCAATYAAIGVVIAVLWLTIGFWRLLFIALFGAIGVFIGGVNNKKDAVRDVINRSFPSKDEPLVDTYDDIKNENKPE